MFRAFFRPSSGAQWLQWQPLVLPSYRGDSRAVFRGRAGRPARPRTQHCYHHDTKVKSEATTAVIELLMMGGKTPETCWAVKNVRIMDWKIFASSWWLIWTFTLIQTPFAWYETQLIRTVDYFPEYGLRVCPGFERICVTNKTFRNETHVMWCF